MRKQSRLNEGGPVSRGSEAERDGVRAPPRPAARRRKATAEPPPAFTIEALEPRILFSADLAPAAQLEILTGLHDLQGALDGLSALPGPATTLPFINRSVAEFGDFGAPLRDAGNVAADYFARTADATLQGLSDAFAGRAGTEHAGIVTAADESEAIALSLKVPVERSQLVFDLSGDVGGLQLAAGSGAPATAIGATQLDITFGIDSRTGAFVLRSAEARQSLDVSTGAIAGDLAINGVATSVASGSGHLQVSASATFADPSDADGLHAIMAAELRGTAPAGLAMLVETGSGRVDLSVAGPDLPAEAVSITLADPLDLGGATIGWQKGSALRDVVDGASELPAPMARFAAPALAATPTPSLVGANALASDIRSFLGSVESALDTGALLGQSLPFVGQNLAKAADLTADLRAKLADLQTELNADLAAAGGTILDALHDDVSSFFSGLGLLKSAAVKLDYTLAGTAGTQHWVRGTSVDAAQVTGFELELKIGQTWTTTDNVSFNFGLPGFGLSVGKDSKINGSIGWSVDLGIGVDGTGAYVLTNLPSQVGLDLSFTLDPAFTAIGEIGFLQALLTEKPGGQHTGLSGTLGATFTAASAGAASGLTGGTRLYLPDLPQIAGAAITPTASLAGHSNLRAALGFNFQKDAGGNYTDESDFPSIGGDLILDWSIGGGATAFPTVGFKDLTLDFGSAIEKFVKRALGPIAPVIDEIAPVAKFMSGTVPVISDILDVVPDIAIPALHEVGFASYNGGDYTWLNLGIDFAVKSGSLPADQAPAVYKGLKAVFDAVGILENLLHSTGAAGAIHLGDFYFGGHEENGKVVGEKDLRLARVLVNSVDQLDSLGNALPDLSGLVNAGTGAAQDYLGGLFGGKLPGIVNDIAGTLNDLGDIGQQILGFVDTGHVGGSSSSGFELTYSFPLIENPASIIALMFGQDVNLVDIDLLGHYTTVSPRIPIFGIDAVIVKLDVFVQFSFDFQLNLQLGYDTRGLRQFAATGDPAKLANGVFLGSDAGHTGEAHPIISAEAAFFLGGQVDLALVRAAIYGGLGANIYIGLNADQPGGTKVHADNFGTFDGDAFLEAGILGPLNFTGELWAQVTVEGSIGISTPFGDITVGASYDILPRTVFLRWPSVSTEHSLIYPLAFYHQNTGELDLYVGGQASRRFDDKVATDYKDAQGRTHDFNGNQDNYWESYVVDIKNDNEFSITAYGVTQTIKGHGRPTLIVAQPGDGNDSIIVNDHTAKGVSVNLVGDRGDDTLQAGDGDSTLVGGEGSDTLIGGRGNDQIAAFGPGDPGPALDERNRIVGGAGNDSILGSAGKDTIEAGNGNDTLDGADGDDSLVAGAGNDLVSGGGGNDYIRSDAGNDTYSGGDGVDTLDFSFEAAGVNVSLATGLATGVSAGSDTIATIENVVGTTSNDVIEGSAQDNLLIGLSGNDVVRGLDGRDIIDGGAGNDSVDGGAGDDTIIGGAGDDSIDAGAGRDVVRGGLDPASAPPGGYPAALTDGNDTLLGGLDDDTLLGGTGRDSVDGGAGRDMIDAGAENDTIFGGSENDTILAGTGADLVDAGTGADTVDGGAGDDTILGSDGNDTVTGGLGLDSIDGGAGLDLIFGNEDADTILGGADADTIDAGAGNDVVDGGTGNDSILGGTGDDTLLGSAGLDSIDGQAGNDSIDGGADDDSILGSAGNDTIFGSGGNDRVDAGDGNDLVDGGAGLDTLWGGAGDDTITGGLDADLIDGGSGNDSLSGGDGSDTIYGSAGDDRIFGEGGNDLLDGGIGNDLLDGGAGNDVVFGREGNDTLLGGDGNDSLYGGDGDDSLDGGAGADLLDGGAGTNTLRGGDGDDTLTVSGGVGNQLYGEAGNDTIYGSPEGPATDTNFYDASPRGDIISGGDGDDTIHGNGGADLLLGDDGDDLILGGAGSDLILGGAGNDTIVAGDGNDTVYGGAGDDSVTGGEGLDTLFGRDGGVALALLATGLLTLKGIAPSSGSDADRDTLLGGAGADRLSGEGGADYLDGGTGPDTVEGGDGEDMILGGGGTGDSLSGGAGADVIIGSDDGGDIVSGGEGDDRIEGRGGNDVLHGDAGDDVVDGGAGADLIEGGAGGDLLLGGAGNDVIYGFAADGTGDDHASDTLFGDFGTNAGEAGSGADDLRGGGGSDVLYGEGGVDRVDPGTGTNDVYEAAERAGTSAYVTPAATPQAVPVAESGPTGSVGLPADTVPLGFWSPIAGPDGIALGGAGQDVRDLSLAAGPSGPVAIWAQENGSVSGIYVAIRQGGAWTGLAGSTEGRGLLAAGEIGFRPSIAVDGNRIVVAWTSVTAGGTAISVRIFDPAANGGAGAWTNPGGAAAISTGGTADDARVVVTTSGPLVLWRDSQDGGQHLYAKRFDGTNWVAFGAGSASGQGLSGTDTVAQDYAVATDGTKVAASWRQVAATGSVLAVREYDGATWLTRSAPNADAPLHDTRTSTSPSLAYSGGSLFLAWADQGDGTTFRQQIYVRREANGVWSDAGAGSASGLGLSPGDTYSEMPRLAASGTTLRLVWSAIDMAGTPEASLRTLSWTGSAFVAASASDVNGKGIGDLDGIASRTSLVLDAAGRPYLATETARGAGVVIRDGGVDAAHVYVADATHSLASILSGHAFVAGDLVLVTAATADAADIVLGAAQSGITIAAVDGVAFGRGITIAGATGATLRNLDVAGPVAVTNTAGVRLAENTFRSGLTLSGATDILVRGNSFVATAGTNLAITGASGGTIRANRIGTGDTGFATGATGLAIGAAFTGTITDNDIARQGRGVVYSVAAPLVGNRIHDNGTGLVTGVDGTGALGLAAGSGANEITNNALGIRLNAARVANQHVGGNVTGVSGSGTIGGDDLGSANLVTENGTGIAAFDGLVRYNRIDRNAIGIAATNRLAIFDNELMFNTDAGIALVGVHDVRIAGNTIRSQVGDAIRLSGGSYDTDIVSNILWADTGTALNVGNDSQAGFWSDDNTLYAGPTGSIVYWTKSFTDILDWQADVARFDLHSVGRTAVDPDRAVPHLFESLAGLFTPMALEAGQRASDLTSAAGDPTGSFIGYRGVANLLGNGDFESGLSGWTVTAGGATTSAGPVAYTGSSVFRSGTAANAIAQQSVDLLAAGYSAASIDAGTLEVGFGGRVQLPSAAVSAKISLVFRDAGGKVVGTTDVLPAGTDIGRYLRVFDTVRVPTGARTADFVFSVTQSGGGTGAVLDGAYLAVVPRGAAFDQGVRGPSSVPAVASPDGRLVLRSPDLYADWELDRPRFITWDSYGGAVGGGVRIELWQDGPNGPTLRSVIADSVPDTGQFSWTPSKSGLDYGDTGLRIRIVSAAHPDVFDISAEPFVVPTAGTTYYVDDGSDAGDQYTPGATGSNRNTGKLATAPKPNPVNLFRTYEIGAGSTVYVDAGSYPLIDTLQLSGSVDRGLGVDTGFTIHGPTGAATANLFPAIPGAKPAALIDLLDADFVSIDHLSLTGGTTALLVQGGSDSLSASYLTATGQAGDAFSIATNSPGRTLDHLSASAAGGIGLRFTGTIGTISFLTTTNTQSGLVATGFVDAIRDSTIVGSREYGLSLTTSGTTAVEGNVISGASTGAVLSGAGITFGHADLGLGRGNIVSGATYVGVDARDGARVLGNTLRDNVGATGLLLRSGSRAANNVVSGNATGIELDTATTLSGNRVYGNSRIGINVATDNAVVAENVVYSNAVGITLSYGGNVAIRNNLVYADTYAGIRIQYGANTRITNNTIYEPVAGSTPDTVFYGGTGAVVLGNTTSGATLANNIIVALAGIGIRVADTAQAGFTSNNNLFATGVTGRVGNWLGIDRTTFAQWRAATQRDGGSRASDPLFVDPDGADGQLGYASPTQDGRDDDFHVQSQDGSYHGGSLAVVRDPATGLPVFPVATLVSDGGESPAIDRGDPATPIGSETAPNGAIVEIGAYGGTAQASRSPAAFLTVTSPDGGETLFQGTVVTITWNRFNVPGTVDLSVSSDGAPFRPIATGIADTGSYSWTIDAALFPAAATYVLRISASDNAAIRDVSNAPFTISPPVHAYYINDASLTGDQYASAAGNDANDGLTAAAPMASLQALLAKYHLTAGDTVFVDTGTYALTTNIVFTSDDSGTGDGASQRLVIQGPTNPGATATFDRTSRASGFYAFEFKGADYVTLKNLAVKGGEWAAYAGDNQASLGITVSGFAITGNSNGIYVGTTDTGFAVEGSSFTAASPNSGSGLYVADVTGTTLTNSTFKNWSTGLNVSGSHNTTARNDIFVDNNAATSTSFSYDLLFDGLTASGGYYGIQTYRSSGFIQNSNVHDTAAFGMTADGVYGLSVVARNNTISNIGGSNSYAAALTVGNLSVAENNVVSNSAIGIRDGYIARNNVVYGNTIAGIYVDFNASATGNKVYGNDIGFVTISNNVTIANNTIYDNTSAGIQINQYSNGINNFTISNNTIVQPSGSAIRAIGNPYNTSIRNNIISLGATATGFEIPASAQVGFTSDYNLFNLAPGAKVGTWSGQSYSFDDWRRLVGFDPNSFTASPGFANPAGPDGLRGVVAGVDHGADDDFSLLSTSPAIDRGDPRSVFRTEPDPDGSRVNIGANGASTLANTSPAELIQLLGQTGSTRYQVGQAATITFRSAGLAAADPVVFLNAGGPALNGPQPWDTFEATGYRTGNASYTRSTTKAVDVSQVDAPAALFQTYDTWYSGLADPGVTYRLPVADGSYRITLLFNDPDSTAAGQRLENIVANGTIVRSNFDIFAVAGGANRAVAVTFDVVASGGTGLVVGVLPVKGDPYISGVQVGRLNAASAPWTAAVDVSLDNGATWSPVASGLALDRFGAGTLNWTPAAATAGSTGLLRITATNGTDTVVDRSIAPFLIAPAGHVYYVNDGASAGDTYTSAVGNDANSGKTPDAPMASLQALLGAYRLQAGDTVYLDAGTYTLSADLRIGTDIAGAAGNPIQIIGAAGGKTVLTRTGTTAGTDAIRIAGTHDIRLANLKIVGGGNGIDVASGSRNITLDGLDISGFGANGVSVAGTVDAFTLSGSVIHDVPANYGSGIALGGDFNSPNVSNGLITGNTFRNLYNGVVASYNASMTITDNVVQNTSNVGISASANVSTSATLVVSGNTVTGGSGTGIDVSATYGGLVSNNVVSGITTGTGIAVIGSNVALVSRNNESFGNRYGYSAGASSVSTGNLIHDNLSVGIVTRGNGGVATISGNTISNNPIGMDVSVTTTAISNNIFYGNTQTGLLIEGTPATIANNTFDQVGGTALKFTNSTASFTLTNNIVRVSAGGRALEVPSAATTNFRSDYDLFRLEGGATMALWSGQAVGTFLDWRFGTGFDLHGTDADPLFVDAQNRDYRLRADSPAIDRADPTTPFTAEPGSNGGRANLGFEGNTKLATQSAAKSVQVLTLNGLEKLELGQPTTIAFRTSGLAAEDAVISYNLGGAAVAGATNATTWRADPTPNNIGQYNSEGAAIDTSGVPFAGPDAIFRESKTAAGGVGNSLKQVIDVADGTYTLRLDFAEYYDKQRYGYTRAFDIKINGVLVTPDFNPYAAAGNSINKAVVKTYTVTAAGGNGITVELVNKTDAGATIAGLQVSRANAGPVTTARVEASYDSGQNWITLGDGVALDAFGTGSFTWTPDRETNGNTALVRVTAGDVSDVSDRAFLIANGGHDYYVNDASATGDEVTSAAGDDLNSGKTPDRPMASLQALITAYRLEAGDVVHVDTGTYTVLTDLTLGQDDSGTGPAGRLTIQGPGAAGHAAVLNRANTANSSTIFNLAGADYVTIANLEMKGGVNGVTVAAGQGSIGLALVGDSIHDQSNDGVVVDGYPASTDLQLTIDGSKIFNNANNGIELSYLRGVSITNTEIFGSRQGIYAHASSQILIDRNSVHDNSGLGIYAYGNISQSSPSGVTISNNRVFNNSLATGGSGIEAIAKVVVSGNTVTGQTGGGAFGIRVSDGADAIGNTVSGNANGIRAQDTGTEVLGNRIFNNTGSGVDLGYYAGSHIGNNQIYSNLKGIYGSIYSNVKAQIDGNVLYLNSGGAIDITGGLAARIVGNTIYQNVGTAVSLKGGAVNSTLANNIIWSDLGTLLAVSAESLAGLAADDNLYYRGASAAANLATLGSTTYATLAAWQGAEPTRNAASREGNPGFIDLNGADNVFGGPDQALGGGADDDFTPGKFSPAIDAADGSLAGPTDGLGQPRRDDPTVTDAGTGPIVSIGSYAPTSTGASSSAFTGSVIQYGYSGAVDVPVSYTLPFAFTLFDRTVTTVRLSSAGYIELDPTASFAAAGSPSAAALQAGTRIAPFWAAIDSLTGGTNLYADATVAGQVKFTWLVRPAANHAGAVGQFSATLFSDGRILFEYGPNLNGLTPVIGISGGPTKTAVAAPNSGRADLAGSASILFTPGGVVRQTYVDIGAIEFQGVSSDASPPAIVSVGNLPAPGGATDLAFTAIPVVFSEALQSAAAVSPASYTLVAAGADGVFDTADDRAITVTPSYAAATKTVTLGLAAPLADGRYRLTVGASVLDTAGNALDGDGNGSAGGAYTRTFTIDRTANHAPVASAAALTVANGTAIAVAPVASDPDGEALTYAIVSGPLHGTIQGFDPATGAFTYRSATGYVGPDTIRFAVDDPRLGHAEATIALTVTAKNTPPVAAPLDVSAIAGQAVAITLPAYDLETPVGSLVLILVAQPTHGTLSVTGQNAVSYTANPGYSGADSFSYAWRDTGAPSGTAGNVLTGSAALVSITVTSTNHAPVAVADAVTVNQDTVLAIPLAQLRQNDFDPDGDPLTVTAVSGATHGTVALDAANGLVTFTPAPGYVGPASFSYTLRDVAGATATGSVTVTVAAVNKPPATAGDSYVATAGLPLTIAKAAGVLANDIDPEGAALTATLVSGPAHGTLALAADGSFTYTATAGYTGPDGFSYRASDGTTQSPTTSVVITVGTPANRTPVAVADTATTNQDTALTIPLAQLRANDSDPDGDTLTITAVSGATHGTVVLVGTNAVFTPTPGYSGPASFSYTLSDGAGGTATGSVAVTVAKVNHAPVAVADAATTDQDTALTIPLSQLRTNDSDPDGDTLTITAVSGATHGTVVLVGTNAVFTPTPGYSGPASFSYTLSDGAGGSATGVVTVAVKPPASGILRNVPKFDAAGHLVQRTIDRADGTHEIDAFALDGLSVVNQFDAGWHNTSSISRDGQGRLVRSFEVGADGVRTTALYDAGRMTQRTIDRVDGTHQIDAFALDGSTVFNRFDAGWHSTSSISRDGQGRLVRTVELDGTGARTTDKYDAGRLAQRTIDRVDGTHEVDTFAADGSTSVVIYDAAFKVVSRNTSPRAVDDAFAVTQDATLSIAASLLAANDVDPDGNAVSVTAVSGATGGTAVLDAGTVVFTPAPGFLGIGGFDDTVRDAGGLTSLGHVEVQVTAPPATTRLVGDRFQTRPGVPLVISIATLLANDVAAPGATLGFAGITGVQNGTATVDLAAGTVTFRPAAGFSSAGGVLAGFEYLMTTGGSTLSGHVTVKVAAMSPERDAHDLAAPAPAAATRSGPTRSGPVLPVVALALSGPALDDALGLAGIGPLADLDMSSAIVAPVPSAPDLVEALFLGGLVLPGFTRSGTVAKARRVPQSVVTFDTSLDRFAEFDAIDDEDLPAFAHPDEDSSGAGWTMVERGASSVPNDAVPITP